MNENKKSYWDDSLLLVCIGSLYPFKRVGKNTDCSFMECMAWRSFKNLSRKDVRNYRYSEKSEADVILMVETYGAAPMVADSLGYSYNLISDNLCIYSRYPIIRKYAFADSISTFNFGGVMIDVNGKPVRVFDTWLLLPSDMLWHQQIEILRRKYWLGRWRGHVMRKYIGF